MFSETDSSVTSMFDLYREKKEEDDEWDDDEEKEDEDAAVKYIA